MRGRALVGFARPRDPGPARPTGRSGTSARTLDGESVARLARTTPADRPAARLGGPAEVRERAGLDEGTSLILLETPGGIVLLTREQLRPSVRDEQAGLDLVSEQLADDAEWAARRWRAGEGLSLADRLCLALAERMDVPVLTADRGWGTSARVRQIR